MKVNPHRSSIGMDANVWAFLLYIITIILGFIPGIQFFAWLFPLIIYLTEKESDFVKFHAMQIVALYVINAIVALIFAIIGAVIAATVALSAYSFSSFALAGAMGGAFVSGAIHLVIGILLTVFAIIAMIKAYQYEEYRIPVVSTLADKFSGLNKR